MRGLSPSVDRGWPRKGYPTMEARKQSRTTPPPLPEVRCEQTDILCQRLGIEQLTWLGLRGWCCRHVLESATVVGGGR